MPASEAPAAAGAACLLPYCALPCLLPAAHAPTCPRHGLASALPHVRRASSLPLSPSPAPPARYCQWIEERLGVHCKWIGVGPGRDAVVVKPKGQC